MFSFALQEPERPPPVPEADRDPDILYDKHGQPVDGKFTKDRVVVIVAAVVFLVLMASWAAQWVAFALPYWHGDAYHTGGLFQVCGTQDLVYDPYRANLWPDPLPSAIHPFRCQTIEEYAADVAKWACDPSKFRNGTKPSAQLNRRGKNELDDLGSGFASKNGSFDPHNDVCVASGLIGPQIRMSRWFQAFTTSMSMVFGVTTIMFMLWPDKSPKKSSRNGMCAILGILLTPWLCVTDLYMQNGYWPRVGVGLFERDARFFLKGAAQASILTSTIDLVVQLGFLNWATHRYGWRLLNFDLGTVGMGPSMSYGNDRAKRLAKEKEVKVKNTVNAVMEMGVPEGVTREQVTQIANAHNADVNRVLEQVHGKSQPTTVPAV
ncbi:hypothetical protein HDU77_000090 [Chytriomyces hyalinus]|nr:hypothetical protein HDU77_000090 [Chytriomyces hyalinus]